MVDSPDKKTAAPAVDGFSMSRWSRLKREAAKEQVTETDNQPFGSRASEALTETSNGDASGLGATGERDVPHAVAPALPPLSSISLTEDFTPFMQAKVPQALKQQALKALFKEPHFNVMDGLDTYIDDYTVFEPISPEVMATLSSWKTIMNPPQQVVTPGGYAVDVESDEGKAVLAAQTEAQTNTPTENIGASEVATVTSDQPIIEISSASALNHPRHGKRVGDFVATAEADVETLESGNHDVIPPVETTTPIFEKDA